MEGPDGRIIPDYGLDDLALDDEGDLDATFADDTVFCLLLPLKLPPERLVQTMELAASIVHGA